MTVSDVFVCPHGRIIGRVQDDHLAGTEWCEVCAQAWEGGFLAPQEDPR